MVFIKRYANHIYIFEMHMASLPLLKYKTCKTFLCYICVFYIISLLLVCIQCQLQHRWTSIVNESKYILILILKNTYITKKLLTASHLDLQIQIDGKGKVLSKLYDKRDNLSFRIVNFPFIRRNIPSTPAYGVFISQLIRYSRACLKSPDFLYRARLLEQGYVTVRSKSSLQKFYGHHELVDRYGVSICTMKTYLFNVS